MLFGWKVLQSLRVDCFLHYGQRVLPTGERAGPEYPFIAVSIEEPISTEVGGQGGSHYFIIFDSKNNLCFASPADE